MSHGPGEAGEEEVKAMGGKGRSYEKREKRKRFSNGAEKEEEKGGKAMG